MYKINIKKESVNANYISFYTTLIFIQYNIMNIWKT